MLLFITSTSYAQKAPTAAEINKKITQKLITYGSPKFSKLKDSVELYTFTIQLKVAKQKDNFLVDEIFSTDSISNIVFKDISFLREIDYTSVMKGKSSATLIIPIAIIIAYVNNPVRPIPMVRAEPLANQLAKFYNYDYKDETKQTSDFIYLSPIIVTAGTKVYN